MDDPRQQHSLPSSRLLNYSDYIPFSALESITARALVHSQVGHEFLWGTLPKIRLMMKGINNWASSEHNTETSPRNSMIIPQQTDRNSLGIERTVGAIIWLFEESDEDPTRPTTCSSHLVAATVQMKLKENEWAPHGNDDYTDKRLSVVLPVSNSYTPYYPEVVVRLPGGMPNLLINSHILLSLPVFNLMLFLSIPGR